MNINKCIVCGAGQFEPYLVCKDYTVSKEDFHIVSCKGCGFKFTNPRPDDSIIGNYYKSDTYVSHSNTKKGFINKLYHAVRSRTLRQKLALINSYVSRGTMLDYGCGTGMFLKTCKDGGWQCFGYEPDAGARKTATEQGLDVSSTKEELRRKLGNKTFDIISLWHVMEHVSDPDATLKFFYSRLSDSGALIIAVPNYASYDGQNYKEFWAGYDVPRHLYHFDKKSISTLFANAGFRLSDTLPMKFDSYYVSLLSESYKTGSMNYVKAFLTGLRSNIKAKPTTNYSSVIYIFKKA